MSLNYPVAPGTIVLCNYDTGFRPPEMVKRRPVVVVSPRLPHRNDLCTVVPLSTTQPKHTLSYIHKLVLNQLLPPPFDKSEMWVKADMLATVSFSRLDLFRTNRDQTGKRKYIHPKVSDNDMENIRLCILHALGFPNK